MPLRCRFTGHDFLNSRASIEYWDGTSQPVCSRRKCLARGERLDRRVPVSEVVLNEPQHVYYIYEEDEL